MDFFNESFWQGVVASLAVTLVIGLLTPIRSRIVDYWDRRTIKKNKRKLDFLKWDKEHLVKVNKSSVALSRAVYSDIFMLLFCLSFGLGLPIIGPVAVSMNSFFSPIVNVLTPLSVPFWGMALVIAFQNIKKLGNLNNYAKAIGKLDSKIKNVEQKIEVISPNQKSQSDA